MVRQNVTIDGVLFTNITPNMLDEDTPWPYVVSSNSTNTNEYLWKAFNVDYLGDGNSYLSLNAGEYVQVDFGENNTKAFSAFRVYGTGSSSCDGAKVTVSTDGDEWTTLYSNDEIFYIQGTVYFMDNENKFRYIRVSFDSDVEINAIEFFDHIVFVGNNNVKVAKVTEDELPESRTVDNGEDTIYFTDENHIYMTPKTGNVVLMSSGDYLSLQNLPDIPEYELQPATTDELGGVIIGNDIMYDDDVISVAGHDYDYYSNLPSINDKTVKDTFELKGTRTEISDTQPTDENVNLWIDTNDNAFFAINNGALIDLASDNGAPIEIRRW